LGLASNAHQRQIRSHRGGHPAKASVDKGHYTEKMAGRSKWLIEQSESPPPAHFVERVLFSQRDYFNVIKLCKSPRPDPERHLALAKTQVGDFNDEVIIQKHPDLRLLGFYAD
jgi:hypothetical protein